jgi:uncharacterized membrane protein
MKTVMDFDKNIGEKTKSKYKELLIFFCLFLVVYIWLKTLVLDFRSLKSDSRLQRFAS